MNGHFRLVCVAALLLSVPLAGAEAEPPALLGPTTLLHCGTLIDGVSASPRKDMLLRVDRNRITSIRPFRGALPRSRSGQVIDLSTATCLPGLIDVHVHILKKDPASSEPQTSPDSLTGQHLRKVLQYGFTTVRNLGDDLGPSDVDVQKALQDGSLVGPRLKIATSVSRVTEVKGPAAARAMVDRRISEGSDWIKLYDTVDPRHEDGAQYTVEELSAVVDEAHSKGVGVAVHAVPFEGTHRAVAGRVDSIEHGVSISDADLRLMKDRGIVLVPTLFVIQYLTVHPRADGKAKWENLLAQSLNTYERAINAGVAIAFGTDLGATEWTWNPAQQLQLMVSHGMQPMSAIQSITMAGARLLKMDKKVGSIEAGKLADIIAVPGDPMLDVSQMEHVTFVMKDGQRVALDQQ